MASKQILVWQCKCNQCGKEWTSRTAAKPKQCPNPKCHSVYWDDVREYVPRKNFNNLSNQALDRLVHKRVMRISDNHIPPYSTKAGNAIEICKKLRSEGRFLIFDNVMHKAVFTRDESKENAVGITDTDARNICIAALLTRKKI